MINVSSFIEIFASSSRNVGDRLAKTDQAARGIGNSWEGDDQEAFYDAYNALSKKVSRANQTFSQVSSKISNLQSRIEAAEEKKKAKNKKVAK